jgi:uncharacterized protein (TIGR00269 family)
VKCRRCGVAAVIELRRHNAAFCGDCFLHHVREQVRKANDEFGMIRPGERVLVAVSGGKDSLGLWDLLLGLGYRADGLYLGLGIGEYSGSSREYARAFAAARGAPLVEIDLPTDYGYDIPAGAVAARRAPCSACGLSKRHLFNRAALDGRYDVVATGHNLDDEAAVLFGNVLRWNTEYLGRQLPVLPAEPGFVRKIKPLIRLDEREMAAYCVVRGIDYIVEECPFAKGATSIAHKQVLDRLEDESPGSKHNFLFGFLEKARPAFEKVENVELHECTSCGQVTTGAICAFCKLADLVKRRTS